MKRTLNSLKETWPEGDGDICVGIIQGNGTATDTEKKKKMTREEGSRNSHIEWISGAGATARRTGKRLPDAGGRGHGDVSNSV